MQEMPKKGDMVTFRRPFKDPQVRLGEVIKTGFNEVTVETGVKGTEEVIKLFVPVDQVFQVR